MFGEDSAGHVDDRTETIKINTGGGGGKQTVGIRTDITFEISGDKNDTKFEGKEAGSDDDVPIVRSGGGASYGDEDIRRSDDRIDFDSNKPIYHRTNDENYDGGAHGTWVNFFPITSAWTTERNFLPKAYGK